MSRTFFQEFSPPPVRRQEIFRYLKTTPEISGPGVEQCLCELLPLLSYRVCYGRFPLAFSSDAVDLGFAKTPSGDLRKALSGCGEIIVFAATVGIAPDRFLARHGALSPTKALYGDAIGTERIEALCDAFEETQAPCRPRFSPGYGDLPLTLQREIFQTLDCQKIGLTLNDSLLMSPCKSVTAIIGR